MRLMHFDLEGQKIIVRTYSPSLDDYDAKESAVPMKATIMWCRTQCEGRRDL